MLLLLLWSVSIDIYFLCTRYEAFYFSPSDNVRHKLQRRSLLRKQYQLRKKNLMGKIGRKPMHEV